VSQKEEIYDKGCMVTLYLNRLVSIRCDWRYRAPLHSGSIDRYQYSRGTCCLQTRLWGHVQLRWRVFCLHLPKILSMIQILFPVFEKHEDIGIIGFRSNTSKLGRAVGFKWYGRLLRSANLTVRLVADSIWTVSIRFLLPCHKTVLFFRV